MMSSRRPAQVTSRPSREPDEAREPSLAGLFETQAERSPHATAVTFLGQELSYGELNRRANRLAHALRDLGVGPDRFVVVCMERSIALVVGLIGVLKAGGAYVPVDPHYPEARRAFVLDDTRAPVLLVSEGIEECRVPDGVRLVRLDDAAEALAGEPETNPEAVAGPRNLAYVIYTSGSTGNPKGVMVQQGSVASYLAWVNDRLLPDPGEGLPAVTSVTFDASLKQILAPLIRGGEVWLMPDGVAMEPARLLHALGERPRVALNCVPSLWRVMLDEIDAGRVTAPAGLRRLLLGGEAVDLVLLERTWARWPAVEIANVYGPTEATANATTATLTPGVPVTIGRPITPAYVRILGPGLQPVPFGAAGELHIGGTGVARGYLGRPDLTAAAFVPDPEGGEPGARLYATGDRVRYRPDGEIEFLGRFDHQVKLRGFRVELGEIETALEQHPGVRHGVLAVVDDHAADKRLVAYVVPAEGAALRAADLRRFLSSRLPGHMVPAAFVLLDRLPLTPSGKLDRSALPVPPTDQPDADTAYEPPRPGAETALAEVWREVLRLPRVGRHDRFFEIGGYSLKAAQVISRLREVLGVSLPFRSFFSCPTLEGMATLVERLADGAAAPPPPIPRVARTEPLPLSFSQERVWFIRSLAPDSRAYNFHATFRLAGPLDAAVLERSLAELIRRHESLRTTFVAVDGAPRQIVHPPWPVRLPLVDLTGRPDDEARAELARVFSAELDTTFDLGRLPLIGWTLVRLSPEEHVLVQVEHHMTHDGWSFNIFLRDLLETYTALCEGRPVELPELPIQWGDFTAWQRQWLQGPEAAAQLDYWKGKLMGAPPQLDLATDRPRPAIPSYRGAAPRQDLPGSLAAALRARAREEGVTLFMLMEAAFAILLHRYTGQDDLCVGSGVANRRRKETEGLIGMAVNNVVLRNDLSGDPTAREVLARVRDVIIDADANQDLPFEKVVEVLRPRRGLSQNPLFQVVFSFHDSPMPPAPPALTVSDLLVGVSANGTAKFDLSVIVAAHSRQRIGPPLADADDGLTLVWEYSTDLFDEATIHRMMEHYRRVLEALVADPGRAISDLPLLSPTERRDLAVGWNENVPGVPARAQPRRAVRGAGAPDARRDRGELRRPDALLRRAEPPGQPARALPPAPRGRT